ncbi:hypothetical protein [Caballeronia arvi]|uniref:hypothetical protein n=1 Tax=Caballeronia arvi TaxID=1777135 RepID=UPI00190ED0F0|nr:hypothetical protein [Caballeronia arvi]
MAAISMQLAASFLPRPDTRRRVEERLAEYAAVFVDNTRALGLRVVDGIGRIGRAMNGFAVGVMSALDIGIKNAIKHDRK